MYIVNKTVYHEDPSKKLGGGSEGSVYPFPKDPQRRCVKLWHPFDPTDRDAKSIAQYRAKKVKAITSMGLRLPDQFVLPDTPAFDDHQVIVGYVMQRVPQGYVKLMKLLDPAFRTSNAIGLKEIALLYALLFEDLGVLGNKGIAIGDVNLGSNMVKFTATSIDRAWVDMDSPGYPGFPCLATTEMFCHPDLYPNLVSGGKFVEPKPSHDRFAYGVEFCLLALHGAHPFRMGIHKSASSLQERTSQGITIFDSTVQYPSFLPSPEVLSDELLDALIQRLKRKTDQPLSADMLREFAAQLVTCSTCNEQYHSSRTHCPKCHEKTIVALHRAMELILKEIYTTSAVLLFVQVIDEKLRAVCRVGTAIHLVALTVDGTPTIIRTTIPATRGARYRFFNDCLVVCPDPYVNAPVTLEVHRIGTNDVQKVQDVTTNALENDSAVFDTSSRFVYRIAGNTLMCGKFLFGGKVFSEDLITQVHQTQSWFTVDRADGTDREAIFGYDRALRELQWFVIRGDRAGEKFDYHQVQLPSMRAQEKLEDFAVYFRADSVLLVRLTRYKGRQNIRYSIIGLDGAVIEDHMLSSGDAGYEHWEHIYGKLFQKGSILHVVPGSVVKQNLAGNTYEILKDTEGVLTAEDRLLRFGNGIGIVRRNAILTLAKKGS